MAEPLIISENVKQRKRMVKEMLSNQINGSGTG
jgi:hypothetical protein